MLLWNIYVEFTLGSTTFWLNPLGTTFTSLALVFRSAGTSSHLNLSSSSLGSVVIVSRLLLEEELFSILGRGIMASLVHNLSMPKIDQTWQDAFCAPRESSPSIADHCILVVKTLVPIEMAFRSLNSRFFLLFRFFNFLLLVEVLTLKGVVVIEVILQTNDSSDFWSHSFFHVISNIGDEIVPEFGIPHSLEHLKPFVKFNRVTRVNKAFFSIFNTSKYVL